MEDYIKYIQKLSLKKDDIILLTLPPDFYASKSKKEYAIRFVNNFESILPYKNKVVIIPKDVDIKVIEKDDQKLLGENWGMNE